MNLTDNQKESLAACIAAWRAGGWHRARRSGERPVLANLHAKGLVERRAHRVGKSSADNAYEYRPSELVRDELSRTGRT